MTTLSRRSFTATIDEGNTLSGLAIPYGQRSRVIQEHGGSFREIIAPGAFDASLKRNDVKLLVAHDHARLLARTRSKTLTIENTSSGLRFSATLPDTTVGRDVREQLQRGDLSGEMSFGFVPLKVTRAIEDKMEVRTVTEGALFEFSVVQDAAYPQTTSELRSAFSDCATERAHALLDIARTLIRKHT